MDDNQINETAQQWRQAAAAVRDNAVLLSSITVPAVLRAWAERQGLASEALWPKFTAELATQLNIDYEQLRTRERAHRDTGARPGGGRSTASIRLYAAGNADVGRFAVCALNGAALWHDKFRPDDYLYVPGEQVSADTSAAEKAVWLAGRALEQVGADSGQLLLNVSSDLIIESALAPTATRFGLTLTLIPAEDSPAVDGCEARGHRDWRDNDLEALVTWEEPLP